MSERPSRRFAFRLALAMRRLDVDAMLAGLTRSEFVEWQAYYLIEPWGAKAEDERHARLCAMVAKTGQPPSAFVYRPPLAARRPPRPLTSREIFAGLTRRG